MRDVILAEDRAAEAAADAAFTAAGAAWRASPAGIADAAERRRRHQQRRIAALAELLCNMCDHGGATEHDLRRSGFSDSEIRAYAQPALQLARSQRPTMGMV